MAGVYTPGTGDDEPTPGTIAEDSGQHFTVTMAAPVLAGQVAVAATMLSLPQANGDTMELMSMHGVNVPATCGRLTAPDPTLPPGARRPAFTDTQVRLAVKSALRAPRTKLRSLPLQHRSRLDLPFTFPEAGSTRLDLIAKGKVVATGTRTRTAGGLANVNIKLSAAARTARKLTLRATFTPSRAGAKPQRASVNVNLRR